MKLEVKQTYTPEKSRYEKGRYVIILTAVPEGAEEEGFRPFVRRSVSASGTYDYDCSGSDSFMFVAHSDQEVRQRVAMIGESIARMFRIWMASRNEAKQPERVTETTALIPIS
ncbi:MAG: hypothetical protein Q7S63_01445 [bacterium]|nr:hypothetical protein [bacterium]